LPTYSKTWQKAKVKSKKGKSKKAKVKSKKKNIIFGNNCKKSVSKRIVRKKWANEQFEILWIRER